MRLILNYLFIYYVLVNVLTIKSSCFFFYVIYLYISEWQLNNTCIINTSRETFAIVMTWIRVTRCLNRDIAS